MRERGELFNMAEFGGLKKANVSESVLVAENGQCISRNNAIYIKI